VREFTATELQAYLQSAQQPPLLLDVREPWEFDVAHIEGALLMPMRSVAERSAELNAEQEIVVICHHGIRSRMIGRFLESQGFSRIINLSGGVNAWAHEVDRRMPTY
jgi:rhodanese-related sulfurtransferase